MSSEVSSPAPWGVSGPIEPEPIRARGYSVKQVEEGLLCLAAAGGSPSKASKLCGLPGDTIASWRNSYPNRYELARRACAEKLEKEVISDVRELLLEANDVYRLALGKIRERIESSSLDDKALVMAARDTAGSQRNLAQTMLALDGRPVNGSAATAQSFREVVSALKERGVVLPQFAQVVDAEVVEEGGND